MKEILFISCLVSVSIFGYSQQTLQHVVATSGNYFANEDVSLSFTLGEAVIIASTTDNLIITQGFQQPEYQVTNYTDESLYVQFNIKIYPNPFANSISVDFQNSPVNNYTLKVFDLTGKMVLLENLRSDTINSIDFTPFSSGQYLFIISSETSGLLGIHVVQKII